VTAQAPLEATPKPEQPAGQSANADDGDKPGQEDGDNPGQGNDGKPSGEGTQPEPLAAEAPPPDDMLRPSGRGSVVVESVRARVSTIGQTHIGSVVINEAGQHYRVPLTDLAALHRGMPFVPPPGYADLSSALAERRILVCSGPDGCGKEMAVTCALTADKAQVVRLLPVSLTVGEMSRVIQAGAGDTDAFVIPGLDEAALRALAGPAGQPIQAAVAAGQVIVAVVTATEPNAAVHRSFNVVRLGYPDSLNVLDGYAKSRRVSQAVHDLAVKVLEQLSPPSCPATIAAILGTATSNPDRAPDELASLFGTSVSSDAIREWIGEGRPPAEVAVLAAGACLSGAPSLVVQERAHELADLLQQAEAKDQSSQLLGSVSWTSGLLRTATEKVNTHFGVQPLEIVEVADPHRPAGVIQAIWRTLDADFRSGYCDWLTELPVAPRLCWHAAYTAGVLFTVDPVLIEERVLRPWARHLQPAVRRCAGLALGAPLAIGADAAPARALANAWATNDSPSLREAAIAAYGGLLGAWDPSSAAVLKLFRIGQSAPDLQREADLAIARLMVAGAEASAGRAGVLVYLKLALADRSTRVRAFGCLPLVTEALCWSRPVCTESLAALRTEAENWAAFTGLLATAMVSPAGVRYGQHCLLALVRAVGRGAVDHDVIEDVIRGMKSSQLGLGTLPRLGSAIRRTLSTLRRSDDDTVADVATALSKQFYR
jgi:hypothetical protein